MEDSPSEESKKRGRVKKRLRRKRKGLGKTPAVNQQFPINSSNLLEPDLESTQ